MRTLSGIVIVLVMAGAAFGQATTQPAESYPALRKRLAELTETVKRLTAENQQLRDRLAQEPRTDATTRPRLLEKRLAKGMTYEQAMAVMGKPEEATKNNGGVEVVVWKEYATEVEPQRADQFGQWIEVTDEQAKRLAQGVQPPTMRRRVRRQIVASFVGGTLTDFTETSYAGTP